MNWESYKSLKNKKEKKVSFKLKKKTKFINIFIIYFAQVDVLKLVQPMYKKY